MSVPCHVIFIYALNKCLIVRMFNTEHSFNCKFVDKMIRYVHIKLNWCI